MLRGVNMRFSAFSVLCALSLCMALSGSATVHAGGAPTEVMFFLDTEDYTDPETADSIKRFADLFASEGVTAHFAIVGFLADQLEDRYLSDRLRWQLWTLRREGPVLRK